MKHFLWLVVALNASAAYAQTYNFFPPPGVTYNSTTHQIATANLQPPGTTGQLSYNNAGAAAGVSAGTSGQPLISAGAATVPAFGPLNLSTAGNTTGILPVTGGGTGLASLTLHGLLIGEGTGNVSAVTAMAADTLLQGQGASADPAAVNINNCGSSTQALSYSTSTHSFGCQTISSLATPVTVPNGGTGLATLTAHGILLGEGTSNVSAVAAMAADTLLQGQGASADPAAVSVNNCGDSSHGLSYSTSTHTFGCQSITGSAATPAGSSGNVQYNNAGAFGGVSNGTSGQALLSNGSSAPSWGTPNIIGTTQSSANSNFPFVGANGTQLVWGAGVTFNPSTNTLNATTFSGTATNATLAATLTVTSSTTNAQFPPILGNGTTMIYDGSVLINPSTHDISATTHTGAVLLTKTTVASLPTCNAGNKGRFQAVTDASGPTYNATVTGGGAVSIPVYCDGTNWTAH